MSRMKTRDPIGMIAYVTRELEDRTAPHHPHHYHNDDQEEGAGNKEGHIRFGHNGEDIEELPLLKACSSWYILTRRERNPAMSPPLSITDRRSSKNVLSFSEGVVSDKWRIAVTTSSPKKSASRTICGILGYLSVDIRSV